MEVIGVSTPAELVAKYLEKKSKHPELTYRDFIHIADLDIPPWLIQAGGALLSELAPAAFNGLVDAGKSLISGGVNWVRDKFGYIEETPVMGSQMAIQDKNYDVALAQYVPTSNDARGPIS